MTHSSLLVKFNLCLIRHVLTVWPLTSASAMMFGHQTVFNDVWLPNISPLDRPLGHVGKKVPIDVAFLLLMESDPILPMLSKTSITKQALMEPTVKAQGEGGGQGKASNVQWKQRWEELQWPSTT